MFKQENCFISLLYIGPVRTIIRKVLVRNPDGTTRIVNETTTIQSKPEPQPQKIQVLRQPDGKLSVRGLQPNQKLVQTQDGKYLILPANSNGETKYIEFAMRKAYNKTFIYSQLLVERLSNKRSFVPPQSSHQQQLRQLCRVLFNSHHKRLSSAQCRRKPSSVLTKWVIYCFSQLFHQL